MGTTTEDKTPRRATGRIKGALQLPQALWVGILLTALTGAGSLLMIWRSNDQALTRTTANLEEHRRTVVRLEAELKDLRQQILVHSQLPGHAGIVIRVTAIEQRIDRGREEDREFRREIKAALNEIRRDLRAALKRKD